MTTTSSFAFPTMEVPPVDDTMEMASPYQGHADDFDIDIDVMEDQASTTDRDMTAEDEFMDSHGANDDHYGSPDEDMVDDLAEPSMVDVDEYSEANPNFEMQYEGEKTYEAEMIEEEYDEDIDAPVPETREEVPTTLERADNQGTTRVSPTGYNEDQREDKPHPGTATGSTDKKQPESQEYSEQRVDLDDQPAGEERETANLEPDHTEETAGNTNQAEQIDPEVAHNDDHHENIEISQPDLGQVQPSIDETREAETESHKDEHFSGSDEHEPEKASGSADRPPLYSVKVYYQDNEISLFPPREGDASETFFLEDESLAYEPLGSLFESCRGILGNHISENEVLVLDIEALNIQLTQDSLHTNKVTLKQIVDVYLQLCHNDGIDEPEALYLTLNTKLTIDAEVSDLLLAASEGKGLSEIHSWEGYHEAEGVSTEFEENPQDPDLEEAEDAAEGEGGRSDAAGYREPESPAHDQAAPSPQQDVLEPQENEEVESIESGEVDIKTTEAEAQNTESPDHNPEHAASPSPEEQKTESSATVEQLAPTDVPQEQSEQGEITELSYDDHNSQHDYQEGGEHVEAHYEEEDNVGISGHTDGFEETEGELTEGHLEEYHETESEHHGQSVPSDAPGNDPSLNNEDVIAATLPTEDDSKQEEPVLDGVSQISKSHQSPHLVDDSRGMAEHLLKNSPGNDPNVIGQHGEDGDENEPDELNEDTAYASGFTENDGEGAVLPFDNGEDYFDLSVTEDFDVDEGTDAVSPSHGRAKRSREPDDDFDLPEVTTPEVKRSRSS